MRYFSLILAAALVACIPPTSYKVLTMTTTPAPDEYAAYRAAGTATISGQAFLTTRGGDVKRGAGRAVTLDPATRYAREWYEQIGMERDRFVEMPGDTLFRAARRTAVADADGKFTFRNLAPGTYLVRTAVTWEVPSGSAYLPMEVQGGVVSAVVAVKSGETADVILNMMGNAFIR